MKWLLDNIATLSTLLISIGVISFYGSKLLALLKEVKQLLDALTNAFDPNSPGGTAVTTEELQKILKEAKDVPKALRKLLTRKKQGDKQ